MSGALPIRRGLGAVYLLAGLLNAVLMILPGLCALNARLWSLLFFGQFLFLVAGGLGWLAYGYRRAGLFFAEPLIDFLLGIGGFVVLLSAAGWALRRAPLSPWIALSPGAFLLFYGFELIRGRRLGLALEG